MIIIMYVKHQFEFENEKRVLYHNYITANDRNRTYTQLYEVCMV